MRALPAADPAARAHVQIEAGSVIEQASLIIREWHLHERGPSPHRTWNSLRCCCLSKSLRRANLFSSSISACFWCSCNTRVRASFCMEMIRCCSTMTVDCCSTLSRSGHAQSQHHIIIDISLKVQQPRKHPTYATWCLAVSFPPFPDHDV